MIENLMIKEKNLSKDQMKKKGFLNGIVVAVILIIVVIVIYQLLIIPRIKQKTKEKTLANLKETKSYVYVLNKNIAKGEEIDINKDCKIAYLDKDAIPDNVISPANASKFKNMVTRINLDKKTNLTADMLVKLNEEITSDLKNQDYTDIILSKNLKVGDYIDIRYKHKDGTDDVVVAKKKVLGLNGQTVIFNILENERRYKNNATVSASLSGGTLYTTIYPDPQNQEAAKITYSIDDNVKKLIDSNPNVVKQASDTLTQRNQSQDVNNTNKPQFSGGN